MLTIKYEKLAEQRLRKLMFDTSDKIGKATAKALSDTTREMRTVASTEIRKDVLLKKRIIDRRIHRIFRKTYSKKVIAGIRIHLDRPISLSNLTRKARQTKKGVVYEVKRGTKVILPSGFGPKITKLHGSVYTRTTKTRYPIAKKQYLDLAKDWNAQGVIAKVNATAETRMVHNLNRRLNEMKLREQGKIK